MIIIKIEIKKKFIKKIGTSKDYYAPGTYIKINMSNTISLGANPITKQDVPSKALKKIEKE